MSEQEHHNSTPLDDKHLGLAGKTTRAFIKSPLSPLLYMAMLMMGVFGLFMTPRQEDPQISVPMVDIFVQYAGAEAQQVSNLAIQPLERIMREIPGVKHVYSATERGRGIVTVEFDVGQDMGPSLVKVNDKLASNMNKIPIGVSPPLVQAKGIDDVPAVTLTLWSNAADSNGQPLVNESQLRMLAQSVLQKLNEIPTTGPGFIVGGTREQVKVEVYPERLSGYGISLDQVANAINTANAEQRAGGVETGDTHFNVVTGAFLRSANEINRLVVGDFNGSPIYMHDVAKVEEGPEDVTNLVRYYTGPANKSEERADGVPAVTIAIAKKERTNGVDVAETILERVEELKGVLIPSYVQVSVTRNYGETANEKVNELLFKLFVATGFVFILVLWAFRAFKPAIVVLLVIPVVLLCTVFTAWAIDYTIDRVSLFALIFSIGILVDDAIVVVENIYSRWLHKGETDMATAIDAVREVGNPTILATFTVIAALGAMGFVSGMMGPYMRPIPVLGSAAMLISLFASFVFAPWLAMTKMLLPSMSYLKTAEEREEKMAERLDSFYRRILTSLYESKGKRAAFKLIMWGSLILFCSFFYFHLVVVKMLPLDNKPEFGVVLNLPEGTALPVSANLANQIAENLREMDEVTAVQIYVGTAKPYDFNGMVRHYYLRDKPWQAEVQVQLLNKTKRARSSHEIALEARDRVTRLVENNAPGTRFAVVEMPPGPPVLQTVVAEVHGPDGETRRQVARDMTGFFEQAPTLTDVDNLMKDDAYYWRFQVERDKAVRRGISVDVINRNLAMALGGQVLGDIKKNVGLESVNIVIQVPLAARSKIEGLNDLPIPTQTGSTVPLSELGHFERVREEPIIFKKDLRDVEFVTAEVHGKLSAPVYGMFEVQDELANVKPDGYKSPDGMDVSPYWFEFLTPSDDSESWIEWTGEWTVTYETFRDMGGAFILAIIIIYMLVVWEFGNFRVPALIMAPIPLTLLGIIPAHAVLGAAFTATSMIGWIALAGIIVRNSILLVDYSIHEIQKGVPVMDAVVGSCKARTRPIVITAVALMAGASVILPDPIFNGMAISLVFGVAVSTVLTLVVIPLGCLTASHSLCEVAVATYEGGGVCPVVPLYPAKPKQNTASPGVPIWMRLWSGLFTVVSMIFYLIRGLFLMLGQFFKKTPPSKPAAPAKPAAVSSVVTASDEAKATSGVKPQVAEAKPLKPQPLAGQESAVQSGSAAEDTAPATKRLDDAEKTVNAEPKSEDTTVSASNHENETVTAVFDSEEEATSVAAMTPKKKAPSRKKAAKKTAKKAAKKASKKVLRKKPVVRKKVRVRQSEDETSSQQTNGRRGIRLLDDHDDDDGIL